MKHVLRAGLLALPLLALPSQAWAHGNGFGIGLGPYTAGASVTFGARGWLRPGCDQGPGGCNPFGGGCGYGGGGYGGGQLAPWYTYWPLEAHFNAPAPTHYPYWPQAMAPNLAPNYGGHHAPAAAHYPAPQPVSFQPASYYYQAPSYWYSTGR